MWINTTTLGEFVLHADIRHELWKSNIEAPGVLTDEYLASVGYALLTKVEPAYNPVTQYLAPRTGALVNGVWEKHYDVIPLDPALVANNCHLLTALTPEVTAILQGAGLLEQVQAQVEARRVAALWQAAHDLEYNAISGSAVGLITMGVLQAKPKCLAVQNWIKSIWTEYYTRKASGSSSTDFVSVGACPHSVPELMIELGV